MIRHETLNPPLHIYPIDPWKIIETSFYPRFLAQTETLFSLGNGYLGMRGNFDEGLPVFDNGTFINGFHETWPIPYGEAAFGFAKTGQTMLNVTDGKIIRLYVDDEPFLLPAANLMLYQRVLDMRGGTLEREVLWETASGKQVLIQSSRLVSLRYRHLAAISFQVTILNDSAPVVISSELQGNPPNQINKGDPRQSKGFNGRVMQPQVDYAHDGRLIMGHLAPRSGMTMACAADHLVETDCSWTMESRCGDDHGRVVITVDAQPGKPIQVIKLLTYHTALDEPAKELCIRAERTLNRAVRDGWSSLQECQRSFMDDFWGRSDVEVEGDPDEITRPLGEFQQAIRWNLFQILQATGRADSQGIPAKGLTGQTYEGHYFWDTEIYLLPFLIYTAPNIARNQLMFRYRMLDKARQRAREVNQEGALFPWRTINGEEASAYYAASTAQYHINADIIYALKKYVEITGDRSLLFTEGAEMLVETARLWLDLGFFSARREGRFCINGVTGPDEYNTVVNNNTFTNLMARENLRLAVETVTIMGREHPDLYASLVHRTGLLETEAPDWQKAADSMYIPYDEATGVHLQDDSFFDRKPWDLRSTPRDHFPLLLHYHPLVIYRHQVIKQADVVLAMFLLENEFTPDQKKRNFDYYDPLTTGDSSLSACIQSIVAAEIGDISKAMKYARYAVLMDLADVGGNVRDGCHIASMGGTWMVLVYGFAGMRDYGGRLSFTPRLPPQLGRLKFSLKVRDGILDVEMSKMQTTYHLRQGAGLIIHHLGREIVLKPGSPVQIAAENQVPLAGSGS